MENFSSDCLYGYRLCKSFVRPSSQNHDHMKLCRFYCFFHGVGHVQVCVTRSPIQGRISTASRVGKSERNHKNSQHFRPCAFLFISLTTARAYGSYCTTLGELWVTTLTLSSPQKNVLRDISKLNCSQYPSPTRILLLKKKQQLPICGLRRSTECKINS